jgi:glutamate/aspartate transport system substrate-binding protein
VFARRLSSSRLGGLLLIALLASAPAFAEDSPTLRKIRESGVVTLGYREQSVPFSYLDESQRPIGYSMAICDRIVEAIKARLGVRDLERRLVPVTSATRVPMVANGTVDLECGVTTNNVERQKQVAFTLTTFVAESRLLSKRRAPVMRLEDLRGKNVTSTVGTTSLRHLQELVDARGIPMNIVAARDDPDAFRLVEADRAAAYAMDDVLLRGTIATSRSPADYVISDEALAVEPYGIMLGKGDPVFKKLADDAIARLFASGDIQALYRRWFLAPIPPSQVVIGLPMSEAMKRVVARPTDSPDPAAYRVPTALKNP